MAPQQLHATLLVLLGVLPSFWAKTSFKLHGLQALRLQPTALKHAAVTPTALKHAAVTSLCSACLLTGSPDKALALPPSLNEAIVELSEASYPSTHLGLKRL